MAFYLSPSVNVFEKDLTSIVPAVSTSVGAFAGAFGWGPVLSPSTVSSENSLVQRFGKPTDSTFVSFYTAANFLSYSNNLLLVRCDNEDLKNATSDGSGIKIKNQDDYETNYVDGEASVGPFAAKYPGTLGNSIKVSMCDGATYSNWEYKTLFSTAPGVFNSTGIAETTEYGVKRDAVADGLHIVVIDVLGLFTGTKGAILEKYGYVSKASDAVQSDGTNNYYKHVVNTNSAYVWWMDHPDNTENWGSAAQGTTFDSLSTPVSSILGGGADYGTVSDANLTEAYGLFANSELYDVSLVMCGKASPVVANYVIQNVAEVRRDCVAYVSPHDVSTGDIIKGSGSDASVNKLIAYRNALPSSSYAFLDSGYKYQYDRYNDVYRWIPLNGDIAGLSARTDYTNDPWWSPAGYNRGQIKSVVKLAVNPDKTGRDLLYSAGVNPVVNFPGQGVVLFGDKTLLATPSAFDRINVRRLFIVLEKAISTAAKYQLFEFNDSFTRAQFKHLVEPFLRDVQGRRGIIDFRVKCDDTNNTGEVIDRNEFVADIYIKPSRSINFITLNFIAARSAISFEEIGA